MDARPVSARRTFLGIPMSNAQSPPGPLPRGHPAYRVFNMPPLPESWYVARDRIFQDDPEVSSASSLSIVYPLIILETALRTTLETWTVS